MTLLLDTHVILWWLADDRALGARAREAISNPATVVYVSAASAWEIALRRAVGKLTAPDDLAAQLAPAGLLELPITIADATAAGALPRHHDDPFDRMLIAQAQQRNLTVLTRDPAFAVYGVSVLPAQR